MNNSLIQDQATLLQPDVDVKPSPIHGYGVFAKRHFKTGDVIEECPVILVSETNDRLHNYVFGWPQTDDSALALGYGSIYNHDATPNAHCTFDVKRHLLIFKADRDILPGEEICHNYGENWFASRENKTLPPEIEVLPPPEEKNSHTLLTSLVFLGIFMFTFFHIAIN